MVIKVQNRKQFKRALFFRLFFEIRVFGLQKIFTCKIQRFSATQNFICKKNRVTISFEKLFICKIQRFCNQKGFLQKDFRVISFAKRFYLPNIKILRPNKIPANIDNKKEGAKTSNFSIYGPIPSISIIPNLKCNI